MAVQIYVQIPAYRDNELGATLLDLYHRADRPQDLRTCVLWQRGDEVMSSAVVALPNLEMIEVPFHLSQGANWARRQLQERWQDEPYTLLLDSHHRFAPHWDTSLMEMYNRCAARSPKPLISAYLPDYDPALEPYGRVQRPTKIYPGKRDHGVLVQLAGYPLPFWTALTEPASGEFVGLHFLFTTGIFNREIRLDPNVYYLRDEVLASLQVFTWGYDVYHPHRVLGWHAYDRSSRSPHWSGRPDWHVGQDEALADLRRVLTGTGPQQAGFLGTMRSVADFERRAMIRLVEPR